MRKLKPVKPTMADSKIALIFILLLKVPCLIPSNLLGIESRTSYAHGKEVVKGDFDSSESFLFGCSAAFLENTVKSSRYHLVSHTELKLKVRTLFSTHLLR